MRPHEGTAGLLISLCLFCLVIPTVTGSLPQLAAQIQVNSADPPAAEQGAVNLNVTVGGKGFKKGAAASFVLTGTDNPDGITVNSTTFVGSTTLVANITVADTATIAKFDVKVRNSDGRIGKGTELFAVLAKGSTSSAIPVSNTIADTTAGGQPHGVQSDGLGLYSNLSNGRTDSVTDVIYGICTNCSSTTGDWQLDLSNSANRTVYIDLSSGRFVSGTGVQPAGGSYPANLVSRCFNSEGFADGGYMTLTSAGSSKSNCGLRVNFSYGGANYAFVLSPLKSQHGATVTCLQDNGSSPSACVKWELVAAVPGTSEANAVLLKKGKGGKETEIGRYSTSFDITISRN